MIKAPSKTFIISGVVVLATAAIVIFGKRPIRDAACFALLPPAEKKLVGEWKSISIGATIVATFHPDHTWTSVGGCLDVEGHGRWRVDGSDIVMSIDLPRIDDTLSVKPARKPIQQLVDEDREARDWLARNTKK